jgi:hypothetical protein
MGEGEGGGEQFDLYPPHLNPLPPGERRYFLRNPKFKIQKMIRSYVLRFGYLSLFRV